MNRTLPACLLACGILTFAGFESAGGADPAGKLDAADVNPLRAQWQLFQSYSTTKQQRLRDLDRDLHALTEEKLLHYRKVMEHYLIWLDRLPDADRKKLTQPGMASEEKLHQIRQIRIKEWVETLPKSYRDKWNDTKADLDERSKLKQLWTEEQDARAEEWHLAQRHLSEEGRKNLDRLVSSEDVKENLGPYLGNLIKYAAPLERPLFEFARTNWNNGSYLEAGRVIFYVAERNTLLPGPDNPPRNLDTLPLNVAKLLPDLKGRDKQAKVFREAVTNHFNRWPGFARAVTKYAQEQEIKLPQPLGPAKLVDMPESVRSFAEKKLFPNLQFTEKGRKELKLLESLEGQWPEYPDKLMELARGAKLTVPGWSLPSPELWALNFRVVRKDKKQ